MSKTYTKHRCFFCGKDISSNGLARVAHYRKHVREGLAELLDYVKLRGNDAINSMVFMDD